MAYITYAPVDRQFRTLERDLPPGAPFNQVDPVDGITFGFSLSSRYPLAAGVPDIRFGTIAKTPADNPAILLRAITKVEYDAAYAAEMAAREVEANPPATVPTEITMRQAKLMLHRAGLLAGIEEQIATMPGEDGEEARIEWDTASVLERHHPLVAVMGVPDDQVDSLFIWASAL